MKKALPSSQKCFISRGKVESARSPAVRGRIQSPKVGVPDETPAYPRVQGSSSAQDGTTMGRIGRVRPRRLLPAPCEPKVCIVGSGARASNE